MQSEYTPELGQAIFGQPTQQFKCPEILDAALMSIRQELLWVLWNCRHHEIDPFTNSAESFRCAEFGVWAYDWGSEQQPYNFKHTKSGLEVSWYKYFGRGMSANMSVSPDLAASILDDCLKALRDIEGSKAKQKNQFVPDFAVGPISDVAYF
jgi:hypothetical protein